MKTLENETWGILRVPEILVFLIYNKPQDFPEPPPYRYYNEKCLMSSAFSPMPKRDPITILL